MPTHLKTHCWFLLVRPPLWEKLLILRDSPLSVPQVWHSKIYKRKPNRTQSALKWIQIRNKELAYCLISQLRPYFQYFQRWPDLREEEIKWRYKRDKNWAIWAHLPRTRYRSLGLGPYWQISSRKKRGAISFAHFSLQVFFSKNRSRHVRRASCMNSVSSRFT